MERRGVGEEWERSGRKRTYMSIHHIVFDQLNTSFTAQGAVRCVSYSSRSLIIFNRIFPSHSPFSLSLSLAHSLSLSLSLSCPLSYHCGLLVQIRLGEQHGGVRRE